MASGASNSSLRSRRRLEAPQHPPPRAQNISRHLPQSRAGRAVGSHKAPPPQGPASPPPAFSGTVMAASWHASMAGDSPREAPPALGESRHRNDVKIPVVAPGGWGILTLGATPPAPRRSPPSCTSSALDQVSLARYLLWASQPPQPAYARHPLKTGNPEISRGRWFAVSLQPPEENRLGASRTHLDGALSSLSTG